MRIIVGFEGSCPQSPAGVRQEGPRRFVVFPSWRSSPGISEEAVGRSTRLGVRIAHDGDAAEPVELVIDWQYDDAPPKDRPSFRSREEFMSYRDFVVVGSPDGRQWRTVMADVAGSTATVRLTVPPGVTEVHWHPPYTYTQGEEFVASLRGDGRVAVEQIGSSEEGRHIWCLRITDDSRAARAPAVVRARAHGYESGGSYAMEGIVRWLLSDADWALEALHRYAFHVVPMANPDGVWNGLGRLTAPSGADVVWATASKPDRAHAPVRALVDRLRPQLLVDLHNWQSKTADGLLDLGAPYLERFLQYMPDQLESGKRWQIRDPAPPGPSVPGRETMGEYCRRVHGAVGVSFEFPWFGRTPDDVRRTGARALWALLRAIDEAGAPAATGA